jgi:hypothetical protein
MAVGGWEREADGVVQRLFIGEGTEGAKERRLKVVYCGRGSEGREGKTQGKLGQVGMKRHPRYPQRLNFHISSPLHLSRSQMPEAEVKSRRRKEVGRRKKEARLTRFSIGETNNHTQQTRHGTMRHDCSIVIEWVDADCSFTHMD